MPHHALLVVLALLCLPALARGQTADTPPPGTAESEAEVDPEFAAMQRSFATLVASLRNAGGISDSDRPAITAFLGRVDAFLERSPDHAGAVAMALQLTLWLGDEPRTDALYQRLAELRPDDADIALAWLARKEASPDADPDLLFEAYRLMYERFADSPAAVERWTDRLKARAQYREAIELLETRELDGAESAALAFTLADCLFAEHRFEEGLSVLEAIPMTGRVDSRVRGRVNRLKPDCEQYVELWAAEQALRTAEQEADDLPRVEIQTTRGPIVVELFENEAPNTVANFVSLASDGFYDGTRFHRFEPDFMIQGGDPNSRPDSDGIAGQGNPGYLIPDEHLGDDRRNHFRDSIAMAKRTEPNTGGCQFYFNHRPTPWLNGKHTVFGRVISGLDAARALRQDDEILVVRVVRQRDHDYVPDTLPIQAEPDDAEPADASTETPFP